MKPRKQMLAGSVALILLVPSLASAQAWTPPKGEGFLTMTLQSLEAEKHLFSSPLLPLRLLPRRRGLRPVPS